MPTYEYECSHCGKSFEKFQSISAPPLKRCPKCGHKVKRLLGKGAGLIFKGSGFYTTDYRSEGYKKEQKAEKSGGVEKKGAAKESPKPVAEAAGKAAKDSKS